MKMKGEIDKETDYYLIRFPIQSCIRNTAFVFVNGFMIHKRIYENKKGKFNANRRKKKWG